MDGGPTGPDYGVLQTCEINTKVQLSNLRYRPPRRPDSFCSLQVKRPSLAMAIGHGISAHKMSNYNYMCFDNNIVLFIFVSIMWRTYLKFYRRHYHLVLNRISINKSMSQKFSTLGEWPIVIVNKKSNVNDKFLWEPIKICLLNCFKKYCKTYFICSIIQSPVISLSWAWEKWKGKSKWVTS